MSAYLLSNPPLVPVPHSLLDFLRLHPVHATHYPQPYEVDKGAYLDPIAKAASSFCPVHLCGCVVETILLKERLAQLTQLNLMHGSPIGRDAPLVR